MSKRFCALVFFLSSCLRVSIFAQAPSTLPAQKPDYSQEPFVVEQVSTEIVFENDGTSARKSKMRVHIQSDAGIQRYAVLTFAYQSSTESVDIDYVRVRKPDATSVLTPSDNVQDLASEVTRQAPLYSDLREKHVAVKGLGVNDVLEYQAEWKTTKPLAPGQFWCAHNFSHDGVILEEILQIGVPLERPVRWRSPKSEPAVTATERRRIFTWTSSQLERKSKEQEQKEQETLIYKAARGTLPQPEVQFSSFQAWEEVGRWYNSLQEDRAKPTPEIRAKAAELTKGLVDDRAKAEAIYGYVSSQVHYIGIELGIGRYQPHSATEVLGNQYGDCKDKHTLLAALLNAVGIQASPALIASVRELDPALPSPAQFDHVVSAVRLGDKLTWLDTTAEVGPFEYLVSPMRGKTALVVSADKAPALITTPAEPVHRPSQTFRIDAKLTDTGTLQGKIRRTIQGDDGEVLLRVAFRRVPVPRWKDLVQQVSYGSGFAGEVSEVTVSSPEKTDEPFRFAYNYERKDYPDWSNRRLSSPLPQLALPSLPEKDAKPVNPIWLGPPAETIFESHVELPRGYRPTLPKNMDVTESFAEYHRSFEFKEGTLTTLRRFVVVHGEVLATEYEAYKRFTRVVGAEYELTVPLKSGPWSPTGYQSEIWDLRYSEKADAVRAYDDARESYTKNDLQGEIASLKRALEVDPKFTRAWLWLGEIYRFNRQPDEAVEAYRKAINVDPQQAVSYKALGSTLLSMQKAEDAVSVWQQLIKVAPNDSAGPQGLGSSLLILKRYTEAQSALEAAAQMDSDSPLIHAQLGNACLHAGQHEKAMAAYRKVLELDPRPVLFNDIAHQLAEANESLTIALEYAKRAVSEEGAASHKVNLSQLRAEDLGPTRSLSSYWDTLGWVYFKLGDLDQAEKYLNAAWVLSQSGVVADHLGQVCEHQNKKQAAVRMYRFALNRASKMDKTRERLERLSPGASTANIHGDMEITNELSSMRTTKLPPLTTGEATADFLVTFARDPKTSSVVVEDVKFVGGSDKLKSADAALRSVNFRVSLPADGQPRLLRRGILFCSPHSGCSFTLLNPNDVRSVN